MAVRQVVFMMVLVFVAWEQHNAVDAAPFNEYAEIASPLMKEDDEVNALNVMAEDDDVAEAMNVIAMAAMQGDNLKKSHAELEKIARANPHWVDVALKWGPAIGKKVADKIWG